MNANLFIASTNVFLPTPQGEIKTRLYVVYISKSSIGFAATHTCPAASFVQGAAWGRYLETEGSFTACPSAAVKKLCERAAGNAG
jgi:hypothetical protein